MQLQMKENQELGAQVEQMQKDLAAQQRDLTPSVDPLKAEEKEKIEKDTQEMRKKFEGEEKKHKKQATDGEKNIRELEAKLEAVQRELREKEKENRILNFKISTQRRTIKHKQLKPVSQPLIHVHTKFLLFRS